MDVVVLNRTLRAFKSELSNVLFKQEYEALEDWAVKSGFLTQTESTAFNRARPGSLFDHSLKVMRYLCAFTKNNHLTWEREVSPWIIGMFHDACKADAYVWDENKKEFVWNQNQADKRHGEKSVAILSNILPLTCEEIACIRWHMGIYEGQKIWGAFHMAATEYPNILWTHHADMMASISH